MPLAISNLLDLLRENVKCMKSFFLFGVILLVW